MLVQALLDDVVHAAGAVQVVRYLARGKMARSRYVQDREWFMRQRPCREEIGMRMDDGIRVKARFVQDMVFLVGEFGDRNGRRLIPGQAAWEADVQQLVVPGNMMG